MKVFPQPGGPYSRISTLVYKVTSRYFDREISVQRFKLDSRLYYIFDYSFDFIHTNNVCKHSSNTIASLFLFEFINNRTDVGFDVFCLVLESENLTLDRLKLRNTAFFNNLGQPINYALIRYLSQGFVLSILLLYCLIDLTCA